MVTSNLRKHLWLGEQRTGVGGAWNLDVWRRLGWSPLRRGCYPLGLGSRRLEVPPTAPAPTSHGAETHTSEKRAPSSGCVRLGYGNGSRKQNRLPQIKGAGSSSPAFGSPPSTFHSQNPGAAWKRKSCDVQSRSPVKYEKGNTELRDTSLAASAVM